MSETDNPSAEQPRRKFKKGDIIRCKIGSEFGAEYRCLDNENIALGKVVVSDNDEPNSQSYYAIANHYEFVRHEALPEETNHAPDLVNHPPHYTSGKIECIDAIEAALTPEEFRGFCKGNAMKYCFRERLKGGNQDLAKAAWYLARLQAKESKE